MNRALGVGGCFLPLRFRLKPFTPVWGSIKGHEFGLKLPPMTEWALIAFLTTL